jgi:hypothetical protein
VARKIEHLDDNLPAADVRLTAEDLREIDEAFRHDRHQGRSVVDSARRRDPNAERRRAGGAKAAVARPVNAVRGPDPIAREPMVTSVAEWRIIATINAEPD